MIEDKRVLSKLTECIEAKQPVAMVIVVDVEGSSPRGVGSMMLVDRKGKLLEGTIGGGALEERAKEDAIKCIRHKASRLICYDLDCDPESSCTLPMICGGKVRVFIKVINPRNMLIIAGGGHVGQKLARLAEILDYDVKVIDDREDILTKEHYPATVELILGDIAEKLKEMYIDENTYIVIVTHGHEYDEDCLQNVIDSDAGYIGMIGSVNKIKTCFKNLMNEGVSKQKLSKIYTPIGLDLGGETPEEIALAIMAEIQAVKYEKDICHIRDR